MKRKLLLFFLLALLLTISVCAAQTQTCSIDELHMRIDVPADCNAITRDTKTNDPAMDDYIAGLQQWMKQCDIYLNLQNADPNFQCNLKAGPGPVQSLDLFEDAALDAMLDEHRSNAEAQGNTVTSADLFRSEQTVFLRLEGYQPEADGSQTPVITYTTVNDYQSLVFSVCYTGPQMPERCRALGEELVGSIRFDETAASEPVEASRYEHSETGVSFTVPADWIEVSTPPGVGTPNTVKATFIHRKDGTSTIFYSCQDLMDKLPGAATKLLDRASVNQDTISMDLILGDPGAYEFNRKATETIGGKEFYVVEYTEPTTQIVETDVIHIENGYEYSFEFSGTADDPRYADFLSLVESAEFPDTETATALADKEKESDAPAADGQDAPAGKKKFVFLSLAEIATGLVAVGAALGLIIARGKKKRARQQVFAVPVTPDAPTKRICAACGADLAPDEQICPYCDTRAE